MSGSSSDPSLKRKHPIRIALVLLATSALTLSAVSESFAQGRGFGMSGRAMGASSMGRPLGHGIRPGGISRYPGNDGPRYPGGMGPRRPGGILVVPGGPYRPVGPPVVVVDDDPPPLRKRAPQKKKAQKQRKQQFTQRGGFNAPPAGEQRFVPNEVLLNIPFGISAPTLNAIVQRHRLTQVETRDFLLPPRRLARLRINDGRPVATVIRSLQQEANILGAQPNYYYGLEQASPAASDPTQYAVGKMRLSQAHALAKGESIRVAVIDTTIDARHPDLAGAVAASYNATGKADTPHFHGTGIASVIAAHGKLTGAAPAVKVLAVAAFSSLGAQGSSWHILGGLDWAGTANADVINMSFAGPSDPEMQLKIAALRRRGAVLVAAAGNAGPQARPLYPAAYPEVLAVTATDIDDKIFDKANRGTHIAVAAPGVAILAAAPNESYQMQSGTSFAAAQVSGVVALLLERNRRLDGASIRRILTSTARDLGPAGHDDQFGAGLVDAFGAVESARPKASDVSGSTPGN
jgi:subtilisin family serine protease